MPPVPSLDVEFASASAGDDDNGVKRGREPFENNMDQGYHRNLIEDMYRVEGRENHPYKKMRVDTTPTKSPQPTKKTDFTSAAAAAAAAGNTGLSKWMKDARDAPGSLPLAIPDCVDLTKNKDGARG